MTARKWNGLLPPVMFGADHPNWRGGRCFEKNGYVTVPASPGHPKRTKSGRIYEHVAVAERALGHRLPNGAQVHHVDGDGTNNTPSNLVICQDNAYHSLLHQRQRARDACGNPAWLKCNYCKQYDDPGNIRIYGEVKAHLKCVVDYNRMRRHLRRRAA